MKINLCSPWYTIAEKLLNCCYATITHSLMCLSLEIKSCIKVNSVSLELAPMPLFRLSIRVISHDIVQVVNQSYLPWHCSGCQTELSPMTFRLSIKVISHNIVQVVNQSYLPWHCSGCQSELSDLFHQILILLVHSYQFLLNL